MRKLPQIILICLAISGQVFGGDKLDFCGRKLVAKVQQHDHMASIKSYNQYAVHLAQAHLINDFHTLQAFIYELLHMRVPLSEVVFCVRNTPFAILNNFEPQELIVYIMRSEQMPLSPRAVRILRRNFALPVDMTRILKNTWRGQVQVTFDSVAFKQLALELRRKPGMSEPLFISTLAETPFFSFARLRLSALYALQRELENEDKILEAWLNSRQAL